MPRQRKPKVDASRDQELRVWITKDAMQLYPPPPKAPALMNKCGVRCLIRKDGYGREYVVQTIKEGEEDPFVPEGCRIGFTNFNKYYYEIFEEQSPTKS